MNAQVSKKINDFFVRYPLKSFSKGQVLIHAGDEPAGIFHIIEGYVRQYDITHRGEEVVINVFKSPAFFPASWAINKTPNEYFFEAYTPLKVRLAPAEAVIDFLKANHDVTYDLLSRLYIGAEGMQRRMTYLMAGRGHSRVVYELVIESKRFGRQQPDGSYILDMHEDELARRAGLTRETINRELKKLKGAELIKVNHKNILIRDLERLENELNAAL